MSDLPRAADIHVRTPAAVFGAIRIAYNAAPALLIGAVVTQIIASVSAPVQLIAIRGIIDHVISGDKPATAILVSVLVGLVVLQRLAGLAMSSLITLARQHATSEATSRYLNKAATIDPGYLNFSGFHDRLKHASDAADDRFDGIVFGVVGLCGAVAGLIGLASLLASISPLISLLVTVSMVPWFIAEQRGFRIVHRARARLVPVRRKRDYLRTLLSNGESTEELLASPAGEGIARRYSAESQTLLRRERPAHVRQFLLVAAGNLIGGAVLAIAFIVAATGAINGHLSTGDVVATLAALTAYTHTTATLANSLTQVSQHGPYLRDYFAFLQTPPLLVTPRPPEQLPTKLHPGIELNDVTYRYPGAPESRPALSAVSLSVRPGEMLALVGANGAGKSTLIKLVLRFFDPDEGQVRIGGVDISHCSPPDVRKRTAVLFQDFMRYQLTLRESIEIGAATRDGDRGLQSAIRSAGLATLADDLPEGVDSQLGRLFPGGRELSGGQWQRVAIARLLYTDAPVLILDEPTSNLDAEAEQQTFAELRTALGPNRIGIVISHRFSTVRAADRIGVMSHGELVELGTHDELIARNGVYARLFELQAAGYR